MHSFSRRALRFLVLASLALGFGKSAFGQIIQPGKYSINLLNLTGPGYDYGTSVIIRGSTPFSLTATGQAVGTSTRYTSTGTSLGQDVWYYDSAGGLRLISLTGSGYETTKTGGVYRYSVPFAMNTAGTIVGYNTRGNGSSANDTWINTGTGATKLLFQNGTPIALNSAGQVVGSSGDHTWFYDGSGSSPQFIEPNGAPYINGSITFNPGTAFALNNLGQVVGAIGRYAPDSSSLGTDAWFFTGSGTSQIISLTGTTYEHTTSSGNIYRNSVAQFLTNSGVVVGTASIMGSGGDTGGLDAWFYNGSIPTKVVSPTGTDYQTSTSSGIKRSATVQQVNQAGQVLGNNIRYRNGSNLGSDVWRYDPTTDKTEILNMTGADYEVPTTPVSIRNSSASFMNATGQVAGLVTRYNSTTHNNDDGTDAWFNNGPGYASELASLAGPDYEHPFLTGTVREAQLFALNALGQSVGNNQRYSPTGDQVGFDIWFHDHSGTKRINPAGGDFEGPNTEGAGTVRAGVFTQLNDAGYAIGTASRFTSTGASLGTAGWFFDSATGITTPLIASLTSTNQSYTVPMFVSNNGVVLGAYDRYTSATVDIFGWTLAGGFRDLGDLVSGGLSNNGWQELLNVYKSNIPGGAGQSFDGSPEFIMGQGVPTGTVSSGGTNVYLLTAQAPEPSSALLLISLIAISPRRRRAKNPL